MTRREWWRRQWLRQAEDESLMLAAAMKMATRERDNGDYDRSTGGGGRKAGAEPAGGFACWAGAGPRSELIRCDGGVDVSVGRSGVAEGGGGGARGRGVAGLMGLANHRRHQENAR